MIETRGWTAAIEALDGMCKAANVAMVDFKRLGAGMVTVIVEGDVAAVSAAVETGRRAAERIGELTAFNVIARPHPELFQLLR